ncbi:hypothetical protein D3C74_167360 [compost metagenome]
MEKAGELLGRLPQAVIANAGYGGEENYAYLEMKEITAVVKYGSYHKDKSKALKANISKIENWSYHEAGNTWICPAGQTLHLRREHKEALTNGYEIHKRHYLSTSCEGCPLKERCTKTEGNREVSVVFLKIEHQYQPNYNFTSGPSRF